ncbi:glucokinase [Geomonas silvestris]|uniref:Glucokinase n=1 Tax=Geomonas silvestris TaxID=2740184 RepID=A0A6V8MD15_9BACT|nr:glucokinase [Geomonas silvestris]GFO57891.1 glucokinase [Geomonas silvestris]
MLILAGDVGGTSTRLAFFRVKDGALLALAESHYPSAQYQTLYQIVARFTAEHRLTPERACFGIAGPILEGTVETPNLPWHIDGALLARELGLPRVLLVNDLAANTYGIAALKEEDLLVLNPGNPDPTGTIAVVSAGTGLGESLAYWDGQRHRPLPSEAGHADFAPRSDEEAELLHYLTGEFGRVSYERVISGPGLVNIYRFLCERRYADEEPSVAAALSQGDPAPVITSAALSGSSPLCARALEIFVAVYGAECGNAALRFLATGGVYLGGGIAPRILPKLKEPIFLYAFRTKGRLGDLLATIPVKVILNDRTALLGAACAALV